MREARNQQLLSLIATAGGLLGSLSMDDVLPGILRVSGEFIAADAYAVWRLDRPGKRWYVASHAGVSTEFAGAIISSLDGYTVTTREPIAAEDVTSHPLLASRLDDLRREGIRSMLAIPLVIGGEISATLVFYYRTPHPFPPAEIETAQALGNLATAALRTADLHAEQRRREQQALFLARAASTLAASLDYLQTLKTLVQLAVPDIADWCAVDMLSSQGTIERLAVAHVNAARLKLAEHFNQKYPTRADAPTGIAAVIRTGRSAFLDRLTDEMITAGTTTEEHRSAIRELGITSFMIVPLRTRRGTVGAITFAAAESGRSYTESDLRFAETVADRAAAAIDNAWAYDEARTANQLKDEFLATLSHELRTPLNAIVGYTRMLRSGAVPDERREHSLEVIERNAGTLSQFVEEILDVSRIMSGKLRLNLQAVDLRDLIEDALATVAPAAAAKGLQISSVVDVGAAVLHADPDRLRQVLWNLLTNAVKFTPPSGTVSLRARPTGTAVEIVVTDTGPGIPADVLPFIFERFRQADSRSSREHGGLGLGLSIARNIVEMHGGTISAENTEEGHGARFRIVLPMAPRNA